MTHHRLILEAHDLGRRGDNEKTWLFRGISVSIAAGERIAIVGPSGGGKTVLLRVLAQLDPLDEGRVLWRGATIPGDQMPDFRGRVLYLHQRTPLAEGTVADALRGPFSFRVHRGKCFDRDRIGCWLKMLDRDLTFLDKSTRNLSGGEGQVVAILRALQLDPEILMLDEPTAALDERTTRAVEMLILQWHAERMAQRALVLVTHDDSQATRIAVRRLRMDDGNLTEDN